MCTIQIGFENEDAAQAAETIVEARAGTKPLAPMVFDQVTESLMLLAV